MVSEFSTHSTDETDVFTDTAIVRLPVIENDEIRCSLGGKSMLVSLNEVLGDAQ